MQDHPYADDDHRDREPGHQGLVEVDAESDQSVGNIHSSVSALVKNQYDNIQPRVGATWDLSGTGTLIARGGFGSPSLFVGDQMFFGNDRLPLVKAALERP